MFPDNLDNSGILRTFAHEMKKIVFLSALLLLCVVMVTAVPAYRGAVQMRQPDGSYITLQLHGDEWMNFRTTSDGFSVVKNHRGYYVYAQQKNGRLEATQHVAHDVAERSVSENKWLNDVQKWQVPAIPENVMQLRTAEYKRRSAAINRRRAGGYDYQKFRGLVILVEFKDRSFSRSDYKQVVTDMLCKANYKGYDNTRYGKFTGSVRDYFVDNTNGLFEPTFDVVGPVKVDYSQYVPHKTDSIDCINYEALKKASTLTDYSKFDTDKDGVVDMVFFLYAGLGSNYGDNDERLVWPHASTVVYEGGPVTFDGVTMGPYACSTELYGSEDNNILDGIGTFCHEFSHVLGLPDLYDTDYESNGGESNHPDKWSVMAGGCYENLARTPVGYSLYERYSLGFITPEVINSEGSKRLNPLPLFNKGYRINTEVPKEFFLLENRQPSLFKWDAYLPGHGLLVFRVDSTNTMIWDYNMVNANPKHNYFVMIRAGGGKDASGSDPFPGSKEVTELDIYTKPANLLTWAGKKTQWGIYNIVEQGNIIRFEVREPKAPDGIILPKADAKSGNTQMFNLAGQRVNKDFKGLVIKNGKKFLVK